MLLSYEKVNRQGARVNQPLRGNDYGQAYGVRIWIAAVHLNNDILSCNDAQNEDSMDDSNSTSTATTITQKINNTSNNKNNCLLQVSW